MIERRSYMRINWKPINFLALALMLTSFMVYSPATLSAAEMCKEGKKNLIGSYDVIQARGGLPTAGQSCE